MAGLLDRMPVGQDADHEQSKPGSDNSLSHLRATSVAVHPVRNGDALASYRASHGVKVPAIVLACKSGRSEQDEAARRRRP